MANDVTQLGLVMGAATLINVTHNVRARKDAVPALVASGLMFGGLAVLGELTNKMQLAVAFAWVFLIASLISRGIPLLQSVNTLPESKPATPRKGNND